LSGERKSYESRFERLPEKDAANAREARKAQTYTKGSTGTFVSAEQNCESVAAKRVRDFKAYTEMTGKAKPTHQVMEEWLKGEKDAYKEAKGLSPSSKPKTEVVMEWLKTIRMAYEEAMSLPPNSKPETKDVMEWLKAKRMA
jgi:hypothetical protein